MEAIIEHPSAKGRLVHPDLGGEYIGAGCRGVRNPFDIERRQHMTDQISDQAQTSCVFATKS